MQKKSPLVAQLVTALRGNQAVVQGGETQAEPGGLTEGQSWSQKSGENVTVISTGQNSKESYKGKKGRDKERKMKEEHFRDLQSIFLEYLYT